MGPRLAPLALLLLTLCGFSSSADFAAQMNELKKYASPSQQNTIGTSDSAPFTMIVALGALLIGNSDPDMKEVLDKSVLCALKDANLAAKTKTEFYGAAALTAEQTAGAKKLATTIGIDCAATDEASTCFCQQNNVIFYCVLVKYKLKFAAGQTAGTCDELAKLKAAGTGEMGEAFDYVKLVKHDYSADIKKVFDNEGLDGVLKTLDTKIANFFCDALDSTVETAVENLIGSDIGYVTVEGVVAIAALGPKNVLKMADACKKNDEFKNSVFGKCTCKGSKGFTFCIYKMLADSFQKAEFLECGATKKFHPEKKPKSAPQLLPKPSSAGTAFSLLVPAFAATALLLPR